MQREYELTVITRGDLSEGDNTEVLNKYEEIVKRDGGEILRKEDWGNKKLSYPIKRSFRGYYACYDFVTSPDNVAEMERLMRIDETVLRYLAVRLDAKNETGVVDIEARKVELKQAAEKAQEEREKRERAR